MFLHIKDHILKKILNYQNVLSWNETSFMKNQWQLPVIVSSTIISNKILVIIFEHFLHCILRRATSGEKGEGLPCQFLKVEKSALILQKRYPFLQKGVLILEKKYPVCVHLWFTSSFKMQV